MEIKYYRGYACLGYKELESCCSDVCALYQLSFWEVFKVSSRKASAGLILGVIKHVVIQRSTKKSGDALLQINQVVLPLLLLKGFLTSLSAVFELSLPLRSTLHSSVQGRVSQTQRESPVQSGGVGAYPGLPGYQAGLEGLGLCVLQLGTEVAVCSAYGLSKLILRSNVTELLECLPKAC